MDSMDANLYQYYTGVWTRVMKGHRPVLHRFVDSWIQGTRTCIRTAQSPGEIKRMEVSWTLAKKLDTFAGPGKIKRREVSWTLKLAQKRSRAGRWSWAQKDGLLLLQ